MKRELEEHGSYHKLGKAWAETVTDAASVARSAYLLLLGLEDGKASISAEENALKGVDIRYILFRRHVARLHARHEAQKNALRAVTAATIGMFI